MTVKVVTEIKTLIVKDVETIVNVEFIRGLTEQNTYIYINKDKVIYIEEIE